MTREEYDAKMAALEPMTEEQRKSVTCYLLGHSHIHTSCFGYVHCARCGEQIGDQLGGCFFDPLEVRVGHNCPICRANYDKLGWEDKVFTPDPFLDCEKEKPKKTYVISVKQETTLEIEAESEEAAIEEAYATYLNACAETVDARVVSVKDGGGT